MPDEPEEIIEIEKEEELEDNLPKLTKAQMDFLFLQLSDICNIYFMAIDRPVMDIPRKRKYFLNQILKVLKFCDVIE